MGFNEKNYGISVPSGTGTGGQLAFSNPDGSLGYRYTSLSNNTDRLGIARAIIASAVSTITASANTSAPGVDVMVFDNSKGEGVNTSTYNSGTRNTVDSNGYGVGNVNWNTTIGGNKAYPINLQNNLQAFGANVNVTVRNFSFGGKRIVENRGTDPTNWAMVTLGNYFGTYGKYPDILILGFCGENEYNNGQNPSGYGNITANYYAKLNQIDDFCRTNGIELVILSARPFPDSIATGSTSGYENTDCLFQANEIRKRVSVERGRAFIDLMTPYRKFLDCHRRLKGYDILPDGLHENDAGHQFVASVITRAFLPQIRTLSPGERIVINGTDPADQSPILNTSSYFANGIQYTDLQQQITLTNAQVTALAGGNVIDAWVWVDAPYCPVQVSSLNSDAIGTSTTEAQAARFRIRDYIQPGTDASPTYIVNDLVPGQRLVYALASNSVAAGAARLHPMNGLSYGLNRIQITVPTATPTNGFRVPVIVLDTMARRQSQWTWEPASDGFTLQRKQWPGYLVDATWHYFNGTPTAQETTQHATTFPLDQYNALKDCGDIRCEPAPASASGFGANRVGSSPIVAPDYSNYVSFAPYGRKVLIHLKGKLSDGGFWMAFHGPSWVNDGDITQEGGLIIRRSGTNLIFEPMVDAGKTTVAFSGGTVSYTPTFASDGSCELVLTAQRGVSGGTNGMTISAYTMQSGVPSVLYQSAAALFTTGSINTNCPADGGVFGCGVVVSASAQVQWAILEKAQVYVMATGGNS